MKKTFSLLSICILTMLCLLLLPTQVRATTATEGPFTYVVAQGNAIILNCDTSATGKLTVPATLGGYPVTQIEGETFRNCANLTEIVIPDGVSPVGKLTFSYCAALKSVTLGNGITLIDDSAFFNCANLTQVSFPNTITSIGADAFCGCTNLKSITIPNGVKSIGNSAFTLCSGLTSIVIPDSVTSIGPRAFSGCTGLTSVTLPDSVTSIGSGTFSDCTGLTSITLPGSVTSIGPRAFSGCTGLTSVTLPDSVTSIGSGAFSGCTGLTSITIPNRVGYIDGSTFSNCTGLTSITIPDRVTAIGSGAFFGCSNLTSITLPSNVTLIKSEAFYGCFGLTSITLPRSAYRIDTGAFNKCYNLTDIYFSGSQQQWDNIAIAEDNDYLTRATLHCAANCNNNHQWNSGQITNPATCKEEGVKTYTCTVCSETRTEPIAMLTAHTPGDPATATKDQVCTSCGEVLAPATGESETTPTPDNTDSAGKDFSTVITVIITAGITLLCCGTVAVGIMLYKKEQ